MKTKNNYLNELYKIVLLLGYTFLFIYKKARKSIRRFKRTHSLNASKNRIIAGALLMLVISFTAIIIFRPASADAKSIHEENHYKYFQKYYVEKGDTLWDIANEHKYNETTKEYIEDVCRINHIKSDDIYEGQMIVIPYYSTEIL